jgi:hypothetical protein
MDRFWPCIASQTKDSAVGARDAHRNDLVNPALQMMKDGSLVQGAFHRAESSLKRGSAGCKYARSLQHSGRYGCSLTDNCHRGIRLFVCARVLKARALALLLVIGKPVVASHARIALLQAADGFVNLGGLRKFLSVGQKAGLLLFKDSTPLIFLIVLMAGFAVGEPRFLTPLNLFNILRQVSI